MTRLLQIQEQLQKTIATIGRLEANLVEHPSSPSLQANIGSLQKIQKTFEAEWLEAANQRGFDAKQQWESVAFIPVVSSVEVDLTTGEIITGKFRSADERELVLEQDGLLRRVSRAETRRVVLYQGRHAGRGALWGLGIGAGIGLATGLAMRPVFPSDPVVLPVTLMFSALGTGIGALLGVLVRKRAVIYEVP